MVTGTAGAAGIGNGTATTVARASSIESSSASGATKGSSRPAPSSGNPDPLRLRVDLPPVAQGSKNVFRGRVVEVKASELKVLREEVKRLFEESGHPGFGNDKVHTNFVFYFNRPGYHYSTDGTLKPDAPHYHGKKPDRDKLERAVNDALSQAGVWADDSRASRGVSEKVFLDGLEEQPHILIEVRHLES